MGYRVEIEDGTEPRTFEVSARRTCVGTGPQCQLRLKSPGVAPLHAILRLEQGGLLVDAAGPAPVTVDDLRVLTAALDVGRIVTLGKARLLVVSGDSSLIGRVRTRAGRIVRWRSPVTIALIVSLVLHAAALWSMGSILFSHARVQNDGHLELSLKSSPETIAVRDREPRPKAEPLPPVVEQPRFPDDDLIPPVPVPVEKPVLPPPPPDKEPPPKVPEPPPAAAPPAPAAAAPAPASGGLKPTIGLGAPSVAAGNGEGGPSIPGASFGKGDSAGGNQRAADLLAGDPGGGRALGAVQAGASAARIWVVHGDYDQAELVLKALHIENAPCTKEILESVEIPARLRVLIFNCTGKPLAPDTQARVAAWVAAGGYLVTTDWGVERLIEKGFPDTLIPARRNNRPVLTPDEVINVRAAPGTHELLAGIPRSEETCRWWLEDTSIPFEAAPGAEVEILVQSDNLERRHGTPAVAATFRFGKGRVLHLLGHVYQREGNLRGAYLVQRLLVNFLEEALK